MANEEVAGPSNANPDVVRMHRRWELLPSLAIERILSFLNFIDRSQAAISCKSWTEAFESPELWRKTSLSFSKGSRTEPCFNPRSIVRRFGRSFRELTILNRNVRRRRPDYFYSQMANFFPLLIEENVQVRLFKMPRLDIVARKDQDNRRVNCEHLLTFLRMQTGLVTADFTGGRTFTSCCLEILESLPAENIQHLMIERFFKKLNDIVDPDQYVNTLTRFPHLRSVTLNYRYLNNRVMAAFTEQLEGHLEIFGVLLEKPHNITQVITEESWIELKRKCPRMLVPFFLEHSFHLMQNTLVDSHIMSPRIPISTLTFKLRTRWVFESAGTIFVILPWYANTLRDIQFRLTMYGEDNEFRVGLVNMMRNLPDLEKCILRIRAREFAISEFFDDFLGLLDEQEAERGEVNLKELRVTFRSLTRVIRGTKMQLIGTYTPRFQARGVKLKLAMK